MNYRFLVGILVVFCGLSTVIHDVSASDDLSAVKKVYSLNNGDMLWLGSGSDAELKQSLFLFFKELGVDAPEKAQLVDGNIAKYDESLTALLLLTLAQIDKSKQGNEKRLVELFAASVESAELASFFANIYPNYKEIESLRRKISEYQSLDITVWPYIEDKVLRLGQSTRMVSNLRWILITLGDLPSINVSRYRYSIFDPTIVTGVKSFQKRHGLVITGNLDKKTVKALNTSPLLRIAQMQNNLWRLLSLPSIAPNTYISINIPNYKFVLMGNQRHMLEMDIIVGKPSTPTPTMQTKLVSLTTNPFWTPPASIIYSELLPLHKKEPNTLVQRSFELHKGKRDNPIVRQLAGEDSLQLSALLKEYRLVQAPGRYNALGKFRFSIPNNSSIYMHDTPARYLFANQYRALSHGCIRLSKPRELTKYLFEQQYMVNSHKIENALEHGYSSHFRLQQPIPVFITYNTSWVASDGSIQFRNDIYNMDGDK
ncbi:L,D-transpeptidase family protein [Shewanella sp. KX20019]|uniref:L,D-transpeptidase family protein n=1 Tax=Shewanella sp. KX20019 TaxID=2803864 RepID=UPI0019278845|nr:L,D-transpeptidase family protein [Shewanella sp. KX20019]QQX82299.1 L,D-transpeptidase family protein [Shewanella sp. KX20019]